MMHSICKNFLVILSSAVSLTTFASESCKNYTENIVSCDTSDMNDIIRRTHHEEKLTSSSHILMAFDIDNTLLTTQPGFDLGTTQWWDWQNDLINNDKSSPFLVATNFNELIQINNFIIPLMQTKKIDENIDVQIKREQSHGVKVIALTSRDTGLFPATEKQLVNNNINLKSEWSRELETQGPFVPPNFDFTRPLLYTNGIFMTTGQNKGIVLQYILNQFLLVTKAQPQVIIFIDDSQKNIDNVNAAFKNINNIRLFTYRYSKEEERVNNFANNKNQEKETAQKQWISIKSIQGQWLNMRGIFNGAFNTAF
ncbi:MAG: DUF2608 domain-containing protein [Bdellovibrionota bacterium]